MVFYVVNQNGTLSVLDYTDLMHQTRWKIRTKQECNWWGTIWRCSGQVWNTGKTYERDEQKGRGVTTGTQLHGLTKTVLLHFSNPYYPLDHMYAMPRNMPDANGIIYQVGQHRLQQQGDMFIHTFLYTESGNMNNV